MRNTLERLQHSLRRYEAHIPPSFCRGSSLIYSKWKFKNLCPHPVEYSGHGFRYQEPLAESLEELAGDVAAQIRQAVQCGEEFILFGHSMGGLTAWLAAQELKPSALYVSACEPPGILDAGRYRRYESGDALIEYIKDYKRVSEKRLASKVFMDQILPVIKNDYRILSEYQYKKMEPLDIPIRVFSSREDTLMRCGMMQKWLEYGRDVRFYELPGDHFYIEDDGVRETIVRLIDGMEECRRTMAL